MAKTREPRRPVGRPSAGIQPGEKASEYRRLMLRLPEDTLAELQATGRAIGWPQWRVVVAAMKAYIGAGPVLTDDEKRVVRAVLKLHQKGEGPA